MNKLASNPQIQKAFAFLCLSEKAKITLYNRNRELPVYYIFFKLFAWKGRDAENGAYCLLATLDPERGSEYWYWVHSYWIQALRARIMGIVLD